MKKLLMIYCSSHNKSKSGIPAAGFNTAAAAAMTTSPRTTTTTTSLHSLVTEGKVQTFNFFSPKLINYLRGTAAAAHDPFDKAFHRPWKKIAFFYDWIFKSSVGMCRSHFAKSNFSWRDDHFMIWKWIFYTSWNKIRKYFTKW